MKNIRIFYLKIFIFWVIKFSVYLNRYVFEMDFKIIYYSAGNQCYQRKVVPEVNLVMQPVVNRLN